MTTFTRTWDAAYEAAPADSDDASEGALRIRHLKADIQERMEVDHSHAGDADDGAHKKVTFVDPLGADPSTVADTGYLYTKDVNAKAELFWKDEDGNVYQLTSGGVLAPFESGTVQLFSQAASPTGWTVTGTNDQAIRLRSVAANSEAGTSDFSVVFGLQATDSHTLTEAQMPAHTHDRSFGTHADGAGGTINGVLVNYAAGPNNVSSESVGGGTGHTHNVELRVKYREAFFASKD